MNQIYASLLWRDHQQVLEISKENIIPKPRDDSCVWACMNMEEKSESGIHPSIVFIGSDTY